MTTDDDRISKRYRELPREEPPRHLDDAILAASRRAVHTRPAPLVVPSGRQRWYFPLAAAAIIVLAVAVTVHMEREQPAEEMLSTNSVTAPAAAREPDVREAAPAAKPSAPAPAPSSERRFEMRDEARKERSASSGERARTEVEARTEAPPRLDPQPPPELQKSQEALAASPPAASQDALLAQGAIMSRVEVKPAPAPQAAPSAPAAAARPAPAPAPKAMAVEPKRRMDEGVSGGPQLAASALESPEQWLQGIADLRSQRWHAEADRQLAEFRKRYPEYRISEPMLRRVERPR